MDCRKASFILLGLFIGNTFCKPADPVPPPGGPPGALLPVAMPIHALPHSGIVGAFDNFGAGVANWGNGQGSSVNAFLSGIANGFGTFLSGLFGSGAVNTAFMNYNNRPPVDPNAGAPPPPAGPAAGPVKTPDPAPEPDSR